MRPVTTSRACPAIVTRTVITGLAVLSLFACARPPATNPDTALASIGWWRAVAPRDDLEFRDAAPAVRRSLEYYQRLAPDASLAFGPERVTSLDMIVTLQNFLLIVENETLSGDEKLALIKKNFVLYRSVGSDGRGKALFTGYYEPLLSCRREADDVYRFPLYKRPEDLIEVELSQFGNGFPKSRIFGRVEKSRLVPYYSREDIDWKKLLAGKGLEILWCPDLVDIAVLQVQGSGKVELGDGTILSVLYDGQNGRPYKSIGKYLIDSGVIPKEEMSMQLARQYLRDNPEKIPIVLDQNPSYVFFRLDTGPSVGNIGVPLTPGRSIATDSKLFPKGALALIATRKPVIENNAITSWAPFTRFALNQDTGGAIKGPGRVDLFWGRGAEAELGAGYMQQEGELYFLLRRK